MKLLMLKNFKKTFLSGSFGYVIGDLNIQGLSIKGIENLEDNKNYIIVLNHPIDRIYSNSRIIRSEAQERIKRKPLEIILNKNKTSNHVYIYKLDKKNHYRVLLP